MTAPKSDSAAIRQTVRALREAGWKLDGVWDGEESEPATNEDQAVELVTSLESAHLYVSKDGKGAWVYFVLGNDPEEVVAEHTLNLSYVIDRLLADWLWS